MDLRLWFLVLGAALVGCKGRERHEPAPAPSVPAAARPSASQRPVAAGSSGSSALPVAPLSSVGARDAGPPSDGGSPDALVLVVGGDVNLGRSIGRQLWRGKDVNPFQGVERVLGSADLVFLNLESQLSDQHGETQASWNPLVFTGPPAGADLLARAGIHAVSVANNHIWDYGKKAFFETLSHLRRANVAYVGASEEPDRMFEPVILHKKGFAVALFAVTQIWNQGEIRGHGGEHYVAWASHDQLEPQLRRAREHHDFVVLSYHGGGEYMDLPVTWTRDFAQRAMQTGVDAFVGHHPHVPQGIGWHEGRPILYSLGNLVFRMHRDFRWTGMSFLARLTLRRGAPPVVEACPYRILGDDPLLLDGPNRPAQERILRQHLSQLSVGFGGTTVGEPAADGCMPLTPVEAKRPASGAR